MLNTFIIHVKGAHKREKHIKTQLQKFNLSSEFILDGNKKSITETILDTYFKDEMHKVSAQTSCALKHILAYKRVIEKNLNQALILEDDIILQHNFNEVIEHIINEIKEKRLTNYFISLENSNHDYIKKSEVVEGQTLYKKERGRCAGAYLIDSECAKNMLLQINENRCSLPIDWFHNDLSELQKINIYWSHPYIAVQGSHNGSLPSLIDNKKTGWFRKIVYFFQGKIKSRI